MSFTNLANPPDWDGNALQVDSPSPAWLHYPIVAGSLTNITFNQGTISMWILPDWNSARGPNDWGRLIDVGAYSTNSPSNWWSIYFSPDGSSLNFSSETNGVFTNYLNYPILWDTNTWHFLALTYDMLQSDLYIDGQLVTNGASPIDYIPGAQVVSNGFFVGSDVTGLEQSRSLVDNLATYRESLRDIVACLNSKPRLLYHMGFRGRITRTNIAYANKHRDWRIFQSVAQTLMRRASALYREVALDYDPPGLVFALDSSIISLALNLFPWGYVL